jgi:hypothetical protein
MKLPLKKLDEEIGKSEIQLQAPTKGSGGNRKTQRIRKSRFNADTPGAEVRTREVGEDDDHAFHAEPGRPSFSPSVLSRLYAWHEKLETWREQRGDNGFPMSVYSEMATINEEGGNCNSKTNRA